jgi:hypothetical protein
MRLDVPQEVHFSIVGEEQPAPPGTEQHPTEGVTQEGNLLEEIPGAAGEEKSKENVYQKIQKMTVAEKIKTAILGNKEARTILLRESNKQILLAVIHSPKITDTEIEAISNSRNIPEEILREISKNREWCRNSKIIANLVKNPKTPLDIALRFLSRLDTKSLHDLVKSKNVSAALRTAVIRYLEQKEKKRKG